MARRRSGGSNRNDDTEWGPCTCCYTTRLTIMGGFIMKFRDSGLSERIGKSGEETPWDWHS